MAAIENVTFNQEVLRPNILINEPISKINVPAITMNGNDFFFSEILLKKIVAISISMKNTITKAILTNINYRLLKYANQNL